MRLSKIFLFFIGLMLSLNLSAQNNRKEQLKKQKIELQKEINYVNSLLSENKKASKYSVAQVRNLSKKISIKENLISNINGEINLINNSIKDKKSQIKTLEDELSVLKKDYASIINKTYKSKSSYNRIMFLLSSDNFNQALKRLKYMEQYSNYRKEQGHKIMMHQTKLTSTIEKLKKEKSNKLSLLSEKESEKTSLVSVKGQKQNIVKGLKSKNKKLITEIKEKQRKSTKLQNEIQKIIMEEIRIARENAKKADSSNKSGKTFKQTEEAKALAASFKANKDKLPWPVERGVVVSKYGKHTHPTMKNITIVNHGVDIATSKGTQVRAVFDGVVSSVIMSKGGAKTLLVQHGDYYTVYSNLSKIYITKGQKVNTKQKIGEIYTDSRTGDTVLKFQLWSSKKEQNPANWIFKM